MALGGIGQGKGGVEELPLPSVYKELIDIFDELVGDLRQSALAKDLDASGNLLASIRFEPKILGEEFRFQLILADYYKWVDEGRKPGKMPPIQPIMDWLAHKGLKAQTTLKSRKTLKQLSNKTVKKGFRQKSVQDAQRGYAFAIAKNIAKKGTIKRFGYKGSNFYKEVIPDERELVKSIIKRVAVAAKKDILVDIKVYR